MSSQPPDPSRADKAPAVGSGNALPLGTYLSEFELQSVIGEGGFGIVYRAWDHSLQRRVALKEYMPDSLAARTDGQHVAVRSEALRPTFEIALRSFVNEARMLAQFDHPSLVKVYRFWEANGTAYMVMPFYEGQTLKEKLRSLEGPPDEAWLMSLLDPLTDALSVLHAERCYHRDIAPDNIMLLAPTGRPLLLDFGAARHIIGDMTQALTVMLKPGFAPIEQYAEVPHMKQGPWTDVYALAASVHFALIRKTPPPAVARLVSDSYKPISQQLAGRYSERLLGAIDKALRFGPDQRTRSVAQFRADLGLADLGAATTRPTEPTTTLLPSEPLPATQILAPSEPLPATQVLPAGEALPATQVLPSGGALPATQILEPTIEPTRVEPRTDFPATQLETRTDFAPTRVEARPPFEATRIESRTEFEPTRLEPRTAAAADKTVAPIIERMTPTPTPGPAPSPPAPAKPGRRAIWLILLLLPVLGAGLAYWLQGRREPAQVQPAASAASLPPVAASFDAQAAFDQLLAARTPGFEVKVRVAKQQLRIGRDRLGFELSASRDGFVQVLVLGPDGSLQLLLPNQQVPEQRIKAGQTLTLPQESWALETAEPTGSEHFIVLVSAVARDYSALSQERVEGFLQLPTGERAGALQSRWAERTPMLLGRSAGCDQGQDCQQYGAARFTVEVLR
ncbi:serine/threonine-protein kinase [Pelomonas sp. SE-A7]|uniref:serine/threonine-protein kinase n=1 Tax=Pelomonas sp. SE-A7 TaxID=3054953 RepID=UPI00259D07A0|nr:serine/threonine-protein kinase [Pelomonas sp. SE-A7]MDM4764731.1 serine/threonine-protein kinase [Pelomonas sp. SE-A7]